MSAMSETELQNRFVRGVTWKMIGVFIAGIISVVSSFWIGYNAIQGSIKESRTEFKEGMQTLRSEFRSQIDTVKSNQLKSHYETEMRFQDIEHKIDK